MKTTNQYILDEKSLVKSFLKKIQKIWLIIGFEAAVWILGLFFLIFIHSPGDTHFTVCPFANLGFEFCPGCGLGNSISYLFQCDLSASFHAHPLGIFALIIITMRIITIIKNNRRMYA